MLMEAWIHSDTWCRKMRFVFPLFGYEYQHCLEADRQGKILLDKSAFDHHPASNLCNKGCYNCDVIQCISHNLSRFVFFRFWHWFSRGKSFVFLQIIVDEVDHQSEFSCHSWCARSLFFLQGSLSFLVHLSSFNRGKFFRPGESGKFLHLSGICIGKSSLFTFNGAFLSLRNIFASAVWRKRSHWALSIPPPSLTIHWCDRHS